MIIEVYGKQECELCKSAKKKINHMVNKWHVEETVEIVFQDIETLDGAVESDFHDVFEIPSVLLKSRATRDVVARWDGHAPPSDELHGHLCA
jgi:hypothetical protein